MEQEIHSTVAPGSFSVRFVNNPGCVPWTTGPTTRSSSGSEPNPNRPTTTARHAEPDGTHGARRRSVRPAGLRGGTAATCPGPLYGPLRTTNPWMPSVSRKSSPSTSTCLHGRGDCSPVYSHRPSCTPVRLPTHPGPNGSVRLFQQTRVFDTNGIKARVSIADIRYHLQPTALQMYPFPTMTVDGTIGNI
jgi:hypothetical protein